MPWSNRLVRRLKLKTWVYFWLCLHALLLHALEITCIRFGLDIICSKVDASFSLFGCTTQVNASWKVSNCCYSNLLANEIQGMSAISTVLFLWWLHFGCSGQRPYPQNGYFCTLHVFADNTQLKSLKKFNLQPLATTYCPFDYSFRQKARARKLNNITSTKI